MREKNIFPGYFFIYLKLNQSLKWRFDYMIIVNNETRSQKNGRTLRLILRKSGI